MQHLRLANQLLWELADAGLIVRAEFGPSLGVSQRMPDSAQGGPRPRSLRSLDLAVLADFVAVERPSATIEGEYARVVATLRQPEYANHNLLYQLASRIVNEGQDHFLRFSELEAVMRQYEHDANPTPWLRNITLADATDARVRPVLQIYEQIVKDLTQAYATDSITGRKFIVDARGAMLKLDEACVNLATTHKLGVPFFSP